MHHPVDINLLWDSMRCVIRETAWAAKRHEVGGWRQWRHLTARVKQAFNRVWRVRQANANPSRVAAYLCLCAGLVERAEQTLLLLPSSRSAVIQPYIIMILRRQEERERLRHKKHRRAA